MRCKRVRDGFSCKHSFMTFNDMEIDYRNQFVVPTRNMVQIKYCCFSVLFDSCFAAGSDQDELSHVLQIQTNHQRSRDQTQSSWPSQQPTVYSCLELCGRDQCLKTQHKPYKTVYLQKKLIVTEKNNLVTFLYKYFLLMCHCIRSLATGSPRPE